MGRVHGGKLKVKMAEVMKVIKEIIEKIKKHFFPGVEGERINVITCEDVISADMCKKLRDAAELFKIKAAEVDKMIREAIAKGVTKAKEIFKIVQAKLIEMAKNFKCTDALSKDVCDKIAEVAGKLKVKMAEVMKVIKEIIVKGITKAKEIIEEIKKHFFPGVEGERINVITCEDVISADMCKKLRDAAELFKIKAAEVDKMIREAIAKGVTKAKEIFKIVQAKLIEMAKNFKCTDALSKDVCDKIAEVAGKLKVKMAEVMKVIKEIIVKGITKAKESLKRSRNIFSLVSKEHSSTSSPVKMFFLLICARNCELLPSCSKSRLPKLTK